MQDAGEFLQQKALNSCFEEPMQLLLSSAAKVQFASVVLSSHSEQLFGHSIDGILVCTCGCNMEETNWFVCVMIFILNVEQDSLRAAAASNEPLAVSFGCPIFL